MRLDWFHELPSSLVVLALMAAMMAAAEIGYRAGHRRHERTGETGRGHFSAVQASLLGLLALLLGFTFHMSSLRYQTRRELVMEDANGIAALDLRCRFLPEPTRKEFHQLLRQYVDVLVDATSLDRGAKREQMPQAIAQAEALHSQMCKLVRAAEPDDQLSWGTERMVSLLSEVLSIQRRRIEAYENRVPDTIIGLLFGAAIAAAGAVGYSGGLGKHRGVLASVMLTIFVSGTVYVILDLDQPRRGITQVNQTPMLRQKQLLDHE
jgi:hypothetical protein